MSDADSHTDCVTGDWHLIDIAADEQDIPQHRMNLRFEGESGQLRGAVLHRVNGEGILLAHALLEGPQLRVQMCAPSAAAQSEMPWLVMTRSAGRFEGHWQNQRGEVLGPRLKLVRATT